MANNIDVWTILRRRFPEKEYALMAEVSDAAGFNRSRSADYIAVNLWPSRGLAINGIELKSFRSDWLSELKKPQKAENIFKYCDHFWLLTTDDTIAKLDEIPSNWGWMCIKGSRIIVKKDAPKLTPTDISRHFFAAALKRASDKTKFVHIDSIQDKIDEVKESAKVDAERRNKELQQQFDELKLSVKDFKEASGISLSGYYRWNTSPKKMGEIVNFIENGGSDSIKKQLLGLQETAQIVMNRIADGLKLLQDDSKEA